MIEVSLKTRLELIRFPRNSLNTTLTRHLLTEQQRLDWDWEARSHPRLNAYESLMNSLALTSINDKNLVALEIMEHVPLDEFARLSWEDRACVLNSFFRHDQSNLFHVFLDMIGTPGGPNSELAIRNVLTLHVFAKMHAPPSSPEYWFREFALNLPARDFKALFNSEIHLQQFFYNVEAHDRFIRYRNAYGRNPKRSYTAISSIYWHSQGYTLLEGVNYMLQHLTESNIWAMLNKPSTQLVRSYFQSPDHANFVYNTLLNVKKDYRNVLMGILGSPPSETTSLPTETDATEAWLADMVKLAQTIH